jgi:hypothetical protein
LLGFAWVCLFFMCGNRGINGTGLVRFAENWCVNSYLELHIGRYIYPACRTGYRSF